MEILKTQDLSMSFGGVRAISDVSLAIAAGKITSVIGPNGAGKTTLINVVSGVFAPNEGRIFFRGEDTTGLPTHGLCRLGLVRTFQNLQIFTNMSALENVMVGGHCHDQLNCAAIVLRLPSVRKADVRLRQRSLELLDYVGLGRYADARASDMPYGALKRLEIARALASKPKLLLLDEPAAGLNPRETEEVGRLITNVLRDGCTVLMIEHDMKLVMGLSDHVVVLDGGRLLASGTPDEIRRNQDVVKAYLGGSRH